MERVLLRVKKRNEFSVSFVLMEPCYFGSLTAVQSSSRPQGHTTQHSCLALLEQVLSPGLANRPLLCSLSQRSMSSTDNLLQGRTVRSAPAQALSLY